MWHVSSTNDVIFSFTLKKAKKNGAGEGNRTLATSLEGFKATFTRLPQREELPIEVNETLIVELYSK